MIKYQIRARKRTKAEGGGIWLDVGRGTPAHVFKNALLFDKMMGGDNLEKITEEVLKIADANGVDLDKLTKKVKKDG